MKLARGTESSVQRQLRLREHRTRHLFSWPLLILYVGFLVFVISPMNKRIPAALLSVGAFTLVQLASPRCKLSFSDPLTPANIVQLLFMLQLVVIPISMLSFNVYKGQLPALPSDLAINVGLLVTVLAYISYVLSFSAFSGRQVQRSDIRKIRVSYPSRHMLFFVVAFFILGFIGLRLLIGSFSQYIMYLTSPAFRGILEETVLGKTSGALSTFLRPFLGFSIVLGWCIWVDRRRVKENAFIVGIVTIIAIALLVAINLSFNYNRGAFAGPVLALVAAFVQRVRRIPAKVLFPLGAILLWGLMIWVPYRNSNLYYKDLLRKGQVESLLGESNFVNNIQVYGGAPQFVGFLIEEAGWGQRAYWGRTLFASFLYPVPILGRAFRPESGVAIYNLLIYDNPETIDQVVPFSGELFINFHALGVIFGFGLVGYLFARLQLAFNTARNTFEIYCVFISSIWVAFLIPGSLAVSSQIFIFFFWPIYIYLGLCWLRRFRTRI